MVNATFMAAPFSGKGPVQQEIFVLKLVNMLIRRHGYHEDTVVEGCRMLAYHILRSGTDAIIGGFIICIEKVVNYRPDNRRYECHREVQQRSRKIIYMSANLSGQQNGDKQPHYIYFGVYIGS